jgi:hypothetical protein
MDYEEMVCDGADRIYLAQDTVKWLAYVNTVMCLGLT